MPARPPVAPAAPVALAASALLLSCAALLTGCERREPAPQPRTETAQGAVEGGSVVAQDLRLAAAVKSRLASESQLGALAIEVQIHEGRVLLRGIAPDTDTRRLAAEAARSVAGVVEVSNDLSVQVRPQ